jgi:hypothetical protein
MEKKAYVILKVALEFVLNAITISSQAKPPGLKSLEGR